MSSVEEGGECGAGRDEIRLSQLWMAPTRNELSGLLSSGVRAQQNTACSWQAPNGSMALQVGILVMQILKAENHGSFQSLNGNNAQSTV